MKWKEVIKNKVPTFEETGAFDSPPIIGPDDNTKRFEHAKRDLGQQHKDAQIEISLFLRRKVPSGDVLEELNLLMKSVKGMIINVNRLDVERHRD